MRKRADWHYLRLWLGKAPAIMVLSAALLPGLLPLNCFADDGPKADPAGTATGDRNAAVDAAGNAFVVRNRPTKRLRITRRRKRRTTTIRRRRQRSRWR